MTILNNKRLSRYTYLYFIVIYIFTLFCLSSCSDSTLLKRRKFSVTAILNKTVWFGTAKTIKAEDVVSKECATDKITIMLDTDIPYLGNPSKLKADTITGCLNDCITTQRIIIYNIPVQKGRYSIETLNECGTFLSPANHNYWLLINGSGIYKSFHLDKKFSNWIRISSINKAQGSVKGKFQLNFIDSTGQKINFNKGLFNAKLKKNK